MTWLADTTTRAWIYNIELASWVEEKRDSAENGDVSMLFPPFQHNGKSAKELYAVWCPKHRRYESLASTGKNTDICPLSNYKAVYEKSPCVDNIFRFNAPFRWELNQSNDGAILELKIIYLGVSFSEKIIWQRFCKELVPEIKQWEESYQINMNTPSNEAHYRAISERWRPAYGSIPDTVYKVAMSRVVAYMSHKIQQTVIYPPKLKEIATSNFWLIISRPYDVHSCFLEHFTNQHDYIVGERREDAYPWLCSYFKVKPPKSLRRMYIENPYSFIMYLGVCRLGFKDINAIRLFLIPELMAQCNLQNTRYSVSVDCLRYFCFPGVRNGTDFIFYIRWMLKAGKQEMPLARQTVKLLLDGWGVIHNDTLNMLHEYFYKLSDTVKNRIVRRGLSEDIHNQVAREVLQIEEKRPEFKKSIIYPKEVKGLEDTIDGFSFHVESFLGNFLLIGRTLDNCVASYAKYAECGDCIIVTAQRNGKYAMCIEIRPTINIYEYIADTNPEKEIQFELWQAVGKYNQHLRGEALLACQKWFVAHKFILACNDLGTKQNIFAAVQVEAGET